MSEVWLVSVGAGRFQVPGILAAQRDGIRVFAIDGNPGALGLSLADKSAVADIRSPSAVMHAVTSAGITPNGAAAFVTEAGMQSAGRLRDEFSLYGASLEVASRLSDKFLQRSTWRDGGLPCPDWQMVQTEEEAHCAIEALNDTFVIKPVDSAGGRSVAVLQPGEDWQQAFRAALNTSRRRRVLIESYFIGVEYTVETFSHRGVTAVLAISEKSKVPGSFGVVASGLSSPQLSAPETLMIGDLAKDALRLLGHTDGPGHTEILRSDDGRLCLVEAAGRAGGFMIADGLVPNVSGVDLALATARQAVGLDPMVPLNVPQRPFHLHWLRSFAAVPGRVINISGFDTARRVENICCEPFVSVGDVVGPYDPDRPRLGYILACGDNRAEATVKSEQVASQICIEIERDI